MAEPADLSAPASALPPRTPRALRAITTLRLLLAGTILMPVLVGALAAFSSYRDDYNRAAKALSEVVTVAEENTTKVLDTHLLVAARIDDLLAGLSDAEIHAQEAALHERIAVQIADLPQVAAAFVIDSAGREEVSAKVYPVDREADQSRREDFRALRDPGVHSFISAVRARSLQGGESQPYFTISRSRQAPDGGFRGIIVVALSGSYFGSFYNSLLGAPGQYNATVLKDDGTVLASYSPAADTAAAPRPDPFVAKAIADKNPSGLIESGTLLGGEDRLVAYKRVSDYPVYVTIGQTRASILQDWLRSMVGYVVVGVPAAIALMFLSLLALRRTRREQTALARARDEISRRAALEARLHQAQKLEAVGQLTAGIAHDFNNLLTIIAGNVSQVQEMLPVENSRERRWLDAAMNGCDRAAALSKRVLGFARHEPVDPRRLEINDVIERTLELPWRADGNIVTELRLQRDLWPVFVDPDQLSNALLNLAVNAQDAMAAGGRLTIRTVNCPLQAAEAAEQAGLAPGDYVGIFVSDTGHGMPKEVREQAFNPFFTTKGRSKGTGLGLAQVHGFCTRSGGSCAIDSAPGRGTTIKLYLPRLPHGPGPEGAGRNRDEAAVARAEAGEAGGG